MMRSAPSRIGASRCALDADAVEDRAVALQRMRSAHRLEAAHQHVVGGVEEQHAHRTARRAARARPRASSSKRSRPRTSTTAATLRQRAAAEVGQIEQRPQHLRREVVDDVPAEVLERVGGRGAAGARHAGDDQHLAGFVPALPLSQSSPSLPLAGYQPSDWRGGAWMFCRQLGTDSRHLGDLARVSPRAAP